MAFNFKQRQHQHHDPSFRLPLWAFQRQRSWPYCRMLTALAVLGGLFWLIQVARLVRRDFLHIGSGIGGKGNEGANSTLGFQQIIGIVPPKTSKLSNPLIKAGKATGLKITFEEAVNEEDIKQNDGMKTVVDEEGQSPQPGELGQVASHMKVWQSMINKNIPTALIVESDADWDMRIHTSLSALFDNIKSFTAIDSDSEPLSDRAHARHVPKPPYFEPRTWDVLYLGHCGANLSPLARTALYDDSAAPSRSHEHPAHFSPPSGSFPRKKGERLLFKPNEIACTHAYALSLSAAQQLFQSASDRMAAQNGNSTHQHLVKTLQTLCKDPEKVCLAPFPSLFTPADNPTPSGPVTHAEAGPGIQYSARVNGRANHKNFIFRGGESVWIDEWSTVETMSGFREEKGEMRDYDTMSAGNCLPGSKGCIGWQGDSPPAEIPLPPPLPVEEANLAAEGEGAEKVIDAVGAEGGAAAEGAAAAPAEQPQQPDTPEKPQEEVSTEEVKSK